jgi:hypothetical protein
VGHSAKSASSPSLSDLRQSESAVGPNLSPRDRMALALQLWVPGSTVDTWGAEGMGVA